VKIDTKARKAYCGDMPREPLTIRLETEWLHEDADGETCEYCGDTCYSRVVNCYARVAGAQWGSPVFTLCASCGETLAE